MERSDLKRVRQLSTAVTNLAFEINGKLAVLDTQLSSLEREQEALLNEERALQLVVEALVKLESIWRERYEHLIGDTLTKGVRQVFGDDISVRLETSVERSGLATDMVVVSNGHELDPSLDGGSLVQVLSFLMRTLFVRLYRPPLRPVIILDEALNAVSAEYQPSVAALLKQIVDSLGVQVLLVTHNSVYAEYADAIYSVRKGVVQCESPERT
jgi:hypothetical protein